VSFRRGFKAEAERISCELRAELELGPLDRLDPLCLAGHLEIPVIGLSELAQFDGARLSFIRVLRGAERDAFSAITVFVGARRLVIHNDNHAPTRQASNLTHELSHCILEHPASPILSPEGCRHWDSRLEDEADWLAGALLIPREGALTLTKRRWPIERIAERYGVSEQLCRRRVNETGVAIQAKRWASGW
jgi:hypothetical protein